MHRLPNMPSNYKHKPEIVTHYLVLYPVLGECQNGTGDRLQMGSSCATKTFKVHMNLKDVLDLFSDTYIEPEDSTKCLEIWSYQIRWTNEKAAVDRNSCKYNNKI